MNTNLHNTVTKAAAEHTPKEAILSLVYFIEAECGKVLDVYYTQARAVKEYIVHYKQHIPDAKLVMVKNGVKYTLTPTGSAADYAAATH